VLSPADFGRLFSEFDRSAFRLELLPVYQTPEEAEELAAYLSDGPPPADVGGDTEWRGMLRAGTAAGKQFSRVHVVRSPLSDYLRYECEWGYVINTGLGEDVRILDLSEVDYQSELPPRDFWLFDDRTGVWQHYSPAGEYQGADLATPEEVERLRGWHEELTSAAVPFEQYWASHPQYHRGGR
jgi:hypothetical protein